MKLNWVDRVAIATVPFLLLTVGAIAGVASMRQPDFRWIEVTEDSPLWRPELDSSPVRPTDQELIIPLSGDPVADCWTVMAAMEYADTLAVPLCQAVQQQQG